LNDPKTLVNVTLEDVCREQGRPFFWLSKGDDTMTRTLRSLGESQEVPFLSSPMYCGQVANAVIFGKSYVSDRLGRAVFLNQSHRNYFRQEFIDHYKREIVDETAPHPVIKSECCFFGGYSGDSRFFGHFIFEFLYRLAAFDMLGLLERLPVVVFDKIPQSWLSFIELFGVPAERIVKVPQYPAPRFDTVWVASCPNFLAADAKHYTFWDEGIHRLRERMLGKANRSAPKGPGRVYLGRKGAAHRQLANEDEVWAFLNSKGFEYPEFMGKSATEQIQAVSSAEVIVTVAGSASVMTQFAPANCTIIEIASPKLSGGLGSLGVAAVLGQTFARIAGQEVQSGGDRGHENDLAVDFPLFKKCVELALQKYGHRA